MKHRVNESQLELDYKSIFQKVFKIKSEIITWLKENRISYRMSHEIIKSPDGKIIIQPVDISFENQDDLTTFLLTWQ